MRTVFIPFDVPATIENIWAVNFIFSSRIIMDYMDYLMNIKIIIFFYIHLINIYNTGSIYGKSDPTIQ